MAKPMKRTVPVEVDVSYLHLEPGHYIAIVSGDRAVEVIHKDDGTFQVCVDDQTFDSGVHRYEDIYGSDLLTTAGLAVAASLDVTLSS